MEELALQYFPYPHIVRGERRNGLLIDWPDRCTGCDRHCEQGTQGDIGLCSYGLNYLRIDENLMIAGIVLRDYHLETTARKKMYRAMRHQLVSREDLEKVRLQFGKGIARAAAVVKDRLEDVVSEYRQSKLYQEEIVHRLRPQMEKALAQVHDYKQFVQQIIQNMDVILDKKFPNHSLSEKILKAEHEEAAILWAARVMDEKLEAVAFLQYPERIREVKERGSFHIFNVVQTYVMIYQRKADQGGISVEISGDDCVIIEGNTRALGIIPHTLIDNAIKYAPPNTQVEIKLQHLEEKISFSVASFGPMIRSDETETIFDPFVRGIDAQRMRKEGSGFGLAAAQAVALAHDTHIRVQQGRKQGPEGTYRTTFEVDFRPPVWERR